MADHCCGRTPPTHAVPEPTTSKPGISVAGCPWYSHPIKPEWHPLSSFQSPRKSSGREAGKPIPAAVHRFDVSGSHQQSFIRTVLRERTMFLQAIDRVFHFSAIGSPAKDNSIGSTIGAIANGVTQQTELPERKSRLTPSSRIRSTLRN